MNLPHAFNAHAQPPVWDWIAYRTQQAPAIDPPQADIVIGLQAAYTVDFLQQVLDAKLMYYGRRPRVFAGGFNQFRQELLDSKSAHYKANPNVSVLLLNPRESASPDAFAEVEQIARLHAKAMPESLLVVSNLFCACGDRQKTNTIRAWNERLYDLAWTNPHLRVLDMDTFVGRWGTSRVSDPKHEFLAGMMIAPEMIPYLAEEILAFLYERLGLRKKCLVLDLDDTIWGGIVGEEGLARIQLDVSPPGNVYRAVQETALALRKKGVLLAIASKNNPKDAMEAIDRHPQMILRKEHFAAIEIGWDPKDQMLRRIAETLNIGVDSLVFLDDNPNERELVRAMLPGVTVLDLPKDPAWWPRYMQGLRCFEASTLTAEDGKRAQMYAEGEKRKDLQASSGSLDEYLKSLNTVLTVGEMKAEGDDNLPRIAQLSQRTNQFNLTTRRYTETEIQTLVRNGGRVFWMRVSDRLGDSGLVGVAVIDKIDSAGDLWIDNFFMSCRVIGRNVEVAFMREVLNRLIKEARPAGILGFYTPSEKNMQTGDFYESKLGFKRDLSNDAGQRQYKMRPDDFNLSEVPHVKIERAA